MKKITIDCLLLFLFISLYACNEQTSSDNFIISGTIKNARKSFRLESGYGFEKNDNKIQLDAQGNFHDTIKGKEGLYYIYDYKNFPIPVYLKPRENYGFSYDVTKFDNDGISLSGDGVNISTYFVEKRRDKKFFNPYGDGKSEEEFRKFLNDIKESQLTRLENSTLPNYIEAYERKSIAYEYLKYLHLYLALNDIENPSEISKKELDIDYCNEQDYKKFGSYSGIVSEYYEGKLLKKEKIMKKSDPDFSIALTAFRGLDSLVPNTYIKNQLMADIGLYYLKYSPDIKSTYNDFKKYYTGNDTVVKNEMLDLYLRFIELKKGILSPKFTDYKNYKGGTNSLDDFKGSYVFIDLWASWCGNCFVQMSYLKALEEEYKNSNIIFVSIAKDNEEDWRKTIQEKQLTGVQLLVNDNSFYEAYAVYGIPRYMLIDPNGNIVDHNTPRPSEKELKELFQSVGL